MARERQDEHLPGQGLDYGKMPGHWLLAQMGKRVLRPGGLQATRSMLKSLDIGARDNVVEFAPGLGVTAREALAQSPASYTGVERDDKAARQASKFLKGPGRQCLVGKAEDTGLPDASATVVFGEAMLTMQTPGHKISIVAEAKRLLQDGGRYGIHELCLQPDDLNDAKKDEINRALSDAIRVGARPLTPSEWRELLEPKRFIADEGPLRTLRFLSRVLRHPAARRRILRMRSVFRRYEANMGAISMVAVKKAAGETAE